MATKTREFSALEASSSFKSNQRWHQRCGGTTFPLQMVSLVVFSSLNLSRPDLRQKIIRDQLGHVNLRGVLPLKKGKEANL